MRALFITKGNRNIPSSRVRAIQYFPYLESKGIKIKHIIYRSGLYLRLIDRLKHKNIIYKLLMRIIILILKAFDYFLFSNIKIIIIWFTYKNFDAVFLQKIVLPRALIRKISKQCQLIFDFDDAIYLTNKLLSTKQFNNQIALSNLVSVANQDALTYVRSIGNAKCNIINGPIDTTRYTPVQFGKKEHLTIGWIGSYSSVNYLDIIKEPLLQIEKNYPKKISVVIIGDPDYKFPGIPTRSYPWNEETEAEILSTIDIGIMPLYNDEFSRGKGGYKLLQYMASGKANISSDVGINSTIVEKGKSGFIVKSDQEWYNAIESYIIDPDLIKQHGDRSRKIAEEKYSLEHWVDYYITYLVESERNG